MRRTPLYDAHRALGARMVDFAGWEMPVQYSGIVDEHHAVRRCAGLFDVSHMGEIEISGTQALAACQNLTINDVSRLRDGQAQYSVLCLPGGGAIDDVIVYRRGADRFFFCVNASNRETDYEWMREHAGGAEVADRSDDYALLALQGPRATEILARLTALSLTTVPPFAFVEGEVAGRSALVSHTGYTGEDGWEIYCDAANARPIWDAMLSGGEPSGLRPAGLGARDTLRLEAALALYGHELTRDRTPLEARLGWVVRFDKGDFIGRDALLRQKAEGLRCRLVGLVLLDPGIARASHLVFAGDERVGEITSGTKSPTLGESIALAYVATAQAEIGNRLQVEVRSRRLAAEVVRLPFYRKSA